jgi:hypothetical protein
MEVSGQLHALAALHPGEEDPAGTQWTGLNFMIDTSEYKKL